MVEQGYAKGLEGVVAAESGICRVDGQAGKLYYRGYSIDDLAQHASYAEVTYLLLYEKLPTAGELEAFAARMAAGRRLPDEVIKMIASFPPQGSAMELLQSVIAYLSGHVPHRIHHSETCNCRNTLHQVAQLPSVIAAFQRFKEGKEPVDARDDLSHGANFLYMLRGEAPDPEEGRIMDRNFVLLAEHGLNASTFTARVVASTLSTCYCSISAAIGALYGSLHGGANARVLDMVEEIGSEENVDAWLDEALAAKRKIMGMGHRVYKVRDPRAGIIERDMKRLASLNGASRTPGILESLERAFRERMERKGKPLYPNVDFFSGAVYELLGIPKHLFTPIFAAARSAGWLAHILEQRVDNRLFRPASLYVGPEPRAYVPIDERKD